MSSTSTHLVANCIHTWSHARPLVTFCARVVKMKPDLHVTFLVTSLLFERLNKEKARSFDVGDESAQRLRIVSMGATTDMIGDGQIEPWWRALVAGEEIVCKQTDTRYAPLPTPPAVIFDVVGVKNIGIVRAISGKSVKIYALWPALTYSILQLFGDTHVGGLGNIHERAEEESRRSGRDFADVAVEIITSKRGDVIRMQGLPPMYDYEYYPQEALGDGKAIVDVLSRVNEVNKTVDGAILISCLSWEKDAVQTARDWMAETSRSVFIAGPLLPTASKSTSTENEKSQSPQGAEIQAFLTKTLETSGRHSLLYISFGSMNWPVKISDKLWAFLDVVMELNIPFIMSAASPLAVVPDEVNEKVKTYGKGVISTWTPQQMILDHPATGWYVSHGGQNSVTESIAAGVPFIMWPFSADQPINAVLATDVHKVGYELLEVRSGPGLQKIFRTGYTPIGTVEAVKDEARDILRRAFGEDGKEKRARLQALQQAALGDWEEGGASRRDVAAFLASL
ncbi:UDP-Glycosyltransferase/glycogen phosphorylase [Epithele typhae]|uniref:UDP-Glycosyltransferase/glycogen phosphorylase n=1 Tax=Epithele typhae TaxID=378194 RepID=UPI0020086946|nr:UDP-Glycosyltransferase/glycogen phosphorylase [Epithele typhae]KAH9925916.1 UDP-Glycosyltransferase/glycogen phosphorylase [Epithele typhae]